MVKNVTEKKENVHFDFIPKPEGSTVLSPPVEILKKGIEKFNNNLVGTFTKGTVSYNKVCEFGRSMWGQSKVLHVGQKDNRTFLFRFTNELSMHNALSRGTWYFLIDLCLFMCGVLR